ncbi:MAG: hypothetical protein IT459_23010 [Planctomycetes bacterium]|nr:hypothetical protein [Planctomycetota bacterium]
MSVNDFLAYCDLPKEEIRSDVFGHRHPFKDIKRRYVFEIIYGQYDVNVARLQDDLRDLRARIRSFESDRAAFERLLAGTPWENRAVLERELERLRNNAVDLAAAAARISDGSPRDSAIASLRMRVSRLDEQVAERSLLLGREDVDIERFSQLAAQLETQIARLTRAIVANQTLLDIEFVVCPRCGASIDDGRGDAEHCYLCLQTPSPAYGRSDLIGEQDRLAAQLAETRSLLASRRKRKESLNAEIRKLQSERQAAGRELDDSLRIFVSDSAARLQEVAASRATVAEGITRIQDYLRLFEKRDHVQVELGQLKSREAELLAELDEAMARRDDVEQRISDLETRFTEILNRLSLPAFLQDAQGKIDRRTYMPTVGGRSFEALQSEGLAVEVNVAHALAHQLNSLAHGLALPNILLIDGISGAFGEKGYDPARVSAIYEQIIKACEASGGALQVIIADTRVPDVARDSIVTELSERERLVPADFLARLRPP